MILQSAVHECVYYFIQFDQICQVVTWTVTFSTWLTCTSAKTILAWPDSEMFIDNVWLFSLLWFAYDGNKVKCFKDKTTFSTHLSVNDVTVTSSTARTLQNFSFQLRHVFVAQGQNLKTISQISTTLHCNSLKRYHSPKKMNHAVARALEVVQH